MTNTEYNKQLDVIALEALKCILRNDSMLLSQTAEFATICAYDYAYCMLKSREIYAR